MLRRRLVGALAVALLAAMPFVAALAPYPLAAGEVAPRGAEQAPVISPHWTFGEGAIPISVEADRIVLALTIDGTRGRFIFDTGAAGTFVTDRFARRAGALRVDRRESVGIGGTFVSNVYHVDTIDFGAGNRLGNVLVATGLDEASFDREGLDGLIGYDLLAESVVEMNLDQREMRILDPRRMRAAPAAGSGVSVALTGGLARIPARFAGRVDVAALVDTGMPLGVLVGNDLITRDHVGFYRDPETSQAYGSSHYQVNFRERPQGYIIQGAGGGRQTLVCGDVSRVKLAALEYRWVRACRTTAAAQREVILGYEFLKRFNIVYDYPDALMVLSRRKG